VDEDRPDLGKMALRLARAVADEERPVLAREDLEMWDYVVLGALARAPAPTQGELARLTGRDPTRLIGHIDGLARRGLVERRPDPTDRRRRVVALTPDGLATFRRCRSGVRDLEEQLLADVPAPDRATFLRVLQQLHDDLDR
jgi:MarR family transcriptional regulator, organic hydroperoxide resistance regulator